jgi:hypothetical protein
MVVVLSSCRTYQGLQVAEGNKYVDLQHGPNRGGSLNNLAVAMMDEGERNFNGKNLARSLKVGEEGTKVFWRYEDVLTFRHAELR